MIYLPACEAFRDRRIRHERSCDPENVGEGVARWCSAGSLSGNNVVSSIVACTFASLDILNTSNEVRNVVSQCRPFVS